MKKVLIISHALLPTIGGTEMYVDYLINFFNEENFEISIYIDAYCNEETKNLYAKQYPKLKIFYAQNLKFNNIDEQNFKFCITFRRWLHLLFFYFYSLKPIKSKNEFQKFYKKNLDYDLIIDNTIVNHSKLRRNSKAITIIHGSPNIYFCFIKKSKNSYNNQTSLSEIFYCYISKFFFNFWNNWKHYTNIVLYSIDTKKEFEKNQKFKKNQNIYYSLSCANPPLSNNKYDPDGEVISILRLDNKSKNLKFMNEVSRNLSKKINIYGEGNDKHLLTDVIVNKPIFDNKKYETIGKASLFIMTSDSEAGCPLSIVEALSMGIPVILRDTFLNAKNIVINNFNGLLFDKEKSPKDVAYEIKKLLSNKKLLLKMSKNSLEFFNNNFTVKKFNENWKRIIKDII